MENFCKRATSEERAVLQRYVNKYKYFYGIYILWCFFTTAFVISGPLYSSQMFPTHAIYPFSVKDQPLRAITFLHQSLVGFQVSSGMSIDIQAAIIMRYAAARFELLTCRLRKSKTGCEFNGCVKEHNQLLR